MIIAGFDPGSLTFGIGVVRKEKSRIDYLYSQVLKLKGNSFNEKMRVLWQNLQELHTHFAIQEAAIEEGFLGKNPHSTNLLAMVRGVIIGFLIHYQIKIASYPARLVKLSVTGNGNALKVQVNRMLKILLNINHLDLNDNESDALAVAYCHSMVKK